MATTRLCSIPGCDKLHDSHGYCNRHRIAFIKYGDPMRRQAVQYGSPLQFLKACLETNTEGCIEWPFARMANGYGAVRYNGRPQVASRVICILAHGEPPAPEYQAAHSCGNGHLGCVNPRHLRWRLPLANTQEKHKHGTMLRGERVPTSKLTDAQVRQIRDRLAEGVPGVVLARQYGVWASTISKIKNSRRRAHP